MDPAAGAVGSAVGAVDPAPVAGPVAVAAGPAPVEGPMAGAVGSVAVAVGSATVVAGSAVVAGTVDPAAITTRPVDVAGSAGYEVVEDPVTAVGSAAVAVSSGFLTWTSSNRKAGIGFSAETRTSIEERSFCK